jgi:hypothetical protein
MSKVKHNYELLKPTEINKINCCLCNSIFDSTYFTVFECKNGIAYLCAYCAKYSINGLDSFDEKKKYIEKRYSTIQKKYLIDTYKCNVEQCSVIYTSGKSKNNRCSSRAIYVNRNNNYYCAKHSKDMNDLKCCVKMNDNLYLYRGRDGTIKCFHGDLYDDRVVQCSSLKEIQWEILHRKIYDYKMVCREINNAIKPDKYYSLKHIIETINSIPSVELIDTYNETKSEGWEFNMVAPMELIYLICGYINEEEMNKVCEVCNIRFDIEKIKHYYEIIYEWKGFQPELTHEITKYINNNVKPENQYKLQKSSINNIAFGLDDIAMVANSDSFDNSESHDI